MKIDIPQAKCHFVKHKILQEVLAQHLDQLIEQGATANSECSQALRKQVDLEKSLKLVNESIPKSKELIKSLDYTTLRKLRTKGTPEEQTWKYTAFHRTPNFKFVLETEFPIREVEYVDEKKKSEWEDVQWVKGGKQFTGTLKNRWNRSAAAHVFLFGYPSEIYAEKIASEKIALQTLIDKKNEVNLELKDTGRHLDKLAIMDVSYKVLVDDCRSDIQRLDGLLHPDQNGIETKRLLKFIEADSIYGLARMLGLRSTGSSVVSLISRESTSEASSLLRGNESMLGIMKMYVSAISMTTEAISTRRDTRETRLSNLAIRIGPSSQQTLHEETTEKEFQRLKEGILNPTSRESLLGSETKQMPTSNLGVRTNSSGNSRYHSNPFKSGYMPKSPGMSMPPPPRRQPPIRLPPPPQPPEPIDEEIETLSLKCKETLVGLDKEYSQYRIKLHKDIQLASEERATTAFDCSEVVQDECKELAWDMRSNEAVIQMLALPKLELGVSAAIKHSDDVVSVFASIWKGKRLELSELNGS